MKSFLVVLFAIVAIKWGNGTVINKGNSRNDPLKSDFITHLPGVDEAPDFNMFSGYLNAGGDKYLHYWLNECIGSCNTIIVWFNGGPGCSSMDGFLTENGPFKFDQQGRLVPNSYSWNRLAHTLYIESPAGVGFSFDDSPGDNIISDVTVSNDNLEALNNFFEKFQNLSHADIYLSGESYAGVYIPMLASAIIRQNSPMRPRLKGLMIGNGLVNSKLNDNSLIFFAYYHGLFGTSLWKELTSNCCEDGNPDRCRFDGQFIQEDCMLAIAKVMHITQNEGINMYNIYHKCATTEEQQMIFFNLPFLGSSNLENSTGQWILRNKRDLAQRFGLVPPCSNASLITDYLNKAEVQEAIHVRPTEWALCATKVHEDYKKVYSDMAPFIKESIKDGVADVRVLLYFGDIDMACNFMGGEWFVDKMGYGLVTARRTWSVTADDGSEQIAGFYKVMDRLTYLTVKGAGHMVPTDKPAVSYAMVERFLADEPF